MNNLEKGDLIFDIESKKEFIIDFIEYYDEITVIYTDEINCKCLPIENVIKLGKSKLANFIIKKIHGIVTTEKEENSFDDLLKKLKPVNINIFDPNFFNSTD